MVVLGFRPKTLSVPKESASTSAPKESKPKTAVEKKEITKSTTPKSTPKPTTNRTPKLPKTQKPKPVNKNKVAAATANWQKLKSLNTLKVTASDTPVMNIFHSSSATTPKPYVSDQEWFGVSTESLQQTAEAIKSAGMLKSNVPAISLFPPPPPNASKEKLSQASRYLALDCEMVGVGPGGLDSALARVSAVNFHGQVLLDVYVKSPEKVVDYRTAVSGIKPGHITPSHEGSEVNQFGQQLLSLRQVQDLVAPLLKGKLVIGHSLRNDFKALMLSTSMNLRRDTSHYAPFRKLADGKSPSLKLLAAQVLGVQIQENVHDSVEDARIAMLLYRAVKKEWESRNFTKQSK